ncbi:hypothetical protein OAV30_00615 [Candidatus Pelagibacter sp.]|nr:hypothetical protein [Candidatus Pelagibacter sp.]
MALQQVKFAPGIDKQDTSVGAVGRWVESDNVRFRYGLPEKVGGWQSLLNQSIVGVSRKLHSFVDLEGNRYTAIGTDKFLLIYFEGQLFDITPFRSNNAGVQTTFTSSTLATNSTSNKQCTITTTSNHNLIEGDMVVLDSVTLPSGTGLSASDFEDKLFQVLSVPTTTTFTIDSLNQATAAISTGGSMTVQPYERVGPAAQSYGYGFGIGNFGGTISGALTNTLSSGINDSVNIIPVTSNTSFPTVGTLAIGTELITYTGKGTNTFTGATRGALGTTAAAHNNSVVVTNATDFTGWGNAVEASTVSLEPGLWSLNNFGQVLVATIANGKTFTWNAGITDRLTTRASTTTTDFPTAIATGVGNPTASRLTLISPTTRHLIHFGTEVTIGDPSTQDDMFIRFANQEEINEYDILAVNSAGSQRLQDGTKIMGALTAKENILVWTDNSLYTMKFVGAPFTFGFEQVGTNCGLIGKNAAIEIDGVAYWMSNNGFFAFDGTVNSLPCSVEDYVYDDCATTKGQQICAGINNLFTEVTWWYPTAPNEFNNRSVTYNYGQTNQPTPMGNWYTGVNENSIRTAWIDSLIYPKPYATAFKSANTGTFPTVVGESGLGQTLFFEHEVGTDQINPDGTTTTLTSFIESFDFALQTDQGIGEYFLAMRRFLPNFKVLTGNAEVTISVADYPADPNTVTSLSPFTIDSTTTKVDTRARGRYAALKIANTGSGESWRFGTFQADLQPDGRR